MKKLFTIVLLFVAFVTVSAQTKKVSVMGDSYSTFTGAIPEGYANYYPNGNNDVKDISQTWWSLFVKAMNYELDKNDSWSGSTICNTGYFGRDASGNSFLSRVEKLGQPDILFVFGGTNDSWANSPIGDYKYSDWTDEELKSFRPALACLLSRLLKQYPNTKIYAILNSELKEEVNASFREICKHYSVQLIELHDIEKQNGHPSIKGMQAICQQLVEAVNGQQDKNNDMSDLVEEPDQQPEFPGGPKKLLKYLNKKIDYPRSAQEKGLQGLICVQFIVDKDGSVCDLKTVGNVFDADCEAEAHRVIKAMPKWKPGMKDGKPVRVAFTVPVMFRMSMDERE